MTLYCRKSGFQHFDGTYYLYSEGGIRAKNNGLGPHDPYELRQYLSSISRKLFIQQGSGVPQKTRILIHIAVKIQNSQMSSYTVSLIKEMQWRSLAFSAYRDNALIYVHRYSFMFPTIRGTAISHRNVYYLYTITDYFTQKSCVLLGSW